MVFKWQIFPKFSNVARLLRMDQIFPGSETYLGDHIFQWLTSITESSVKVWAAWVFEDLPTESFETHFNHIGHCAMKQMFLAIMFKCVGVAHPLISMDPLMFYIATAAETFSRKYWWINDLWNMCSRDFHCSWSVINYKVIFAWQWNAIFSFWFEDDSAHCKT